MKIFTATAALDVGAVTPGTPIRDERQLEFWKYTVRNADHKAMPGLTVKTAIAYSRNVATAKIARKLGSTVQKAGRRLYKTWDRVGLVGKTGRGDLYAVLKVVMPKQSGGEARALWQQLADKAAFDPRAEWSKQA